MSELSAYYGHVRREAADLLSGQGLRVLEVGCGAGATLAHLREQGTAGWVAGVEPFAAAAEVARARLDAFWQADIETFEPPIEAQSLDAVLCLDVLEHLRDPWAAASRLAGLLRPGGAMIVSVPNVRNFSVVLPLLFAGRFRYDPKGGILDQTHLRFFVRESAIALVAQAGLAVDHLAPLGLKRWKNKWIINALLGGALTDLYARQFLIRGVKPAQG